MNEKREALIEKSERLRLAVERARENGDTRRMSLMSIYRRRVNTQIKEMDKKKVESKAKTKTFCKIVRPVK